MNTLGRTSYTYIDTLDMVISIGNWPAADVPPSGAKLGVSAPPPTCNDFRLSTSPG